MLVRVKQEHIDNGNRGQYQSCAIVLAVLEATGAEKAIADDFCIEWGNKVGEFWRMEGMDTPMSLQVFMDKYDMGHPVEPFEFFLVAEY